MTTPKVIVTKTITLPLANGHSVGVTLFEGKASLNITYSGSSQRDESWNENISLTLYELEALQEAIKELLPRKPVTR